MPIYDTHEKRRVAILGIRGLPAAHGGFETFAARLSPYLVEQGWDVSVYCQEDQALEHAGRLQQVWRSTWQGVRRIHIASGPDTPVASMRFDWSCISHVLQHRPDVVLILGYNTAAFALRLRLAGISTVINMDGIEWSRAKWGPLAKFWLYLNDWAGCLFAHHLVADHPQIERHLRSRARAEKISTIPYGTTTLKPEASDPAALQHFGLNAKQFLTIIARPEPENSVLEMVRAFSAKPREHQLVVLGAYQPKTVEYHARVMAAASGQVIFPGAIYDASLLNALRRHSLLYLHGHQVGGTNPSLLEAMGAGNAVLAHDNRFNRWVVRDGAQYFRDEAGCRILLDELLACPERLQQMGRLNLLRAEKVFDWNEVLQSYSELLLDKCPQVDGVVSGFGAGRRAHWRLDADIL